MEQQHDDAQPSFVQNDVTRTDESEVEEQTGYLDDDAASTPSGSGTNIASSSSQNLGPSSLFALLAQRSAAQSQPPPSGGMPRNQSEYDDLHSWTSPRPHSTQTTESRHRHRSSARRRNVSSSDSDSDEVDSQYSATDSDADSALLQQEWEEQLNQLKLMFQIIVFPLFGKYFGRKYAYYRKYVPMSRCAHMLTLAAHSV